MTIKYKWEYNGKPIQFNDKVVWSNVGHSLVLKNPQVLSNISRPDYDTVYFAVQLGPVVQMQASLKGYGNIFLFWLIDKNL